MISDCKGKIANILTRNLKKVTDDATTLTREEKVELLKQIYLSCLVEDCLDGTPFDNKVLDALESILKIPETIPVKTIPKGFITLEDSHGTNFTIHTNAIMEISEVAQGSTKRCWIFANGQHRAVTQTQEEVFKLIKEAK